MMAMMNIVDDGDDVVTCESLTDAVCLERGGVCSLFPDNVQFTCQPAEDILGGCDAGQNLRASGAGQDPAGPLLLELRLVSQTPVNQAGSAAQRLLLIAQLSGSVGARSILGGHLHSLAPTIAGPMPLDVDLNFTDVACLDDVDGTTSCALSAVVPANVVVSGFAGTISTSRGRSSVACQALSPGDAAFISEIDWIQSTTVLDAAEFVEVKNASTSRFMSMRGLHLAVISRDGEILEDLSIGGQLHPMGAVVLGNVDEALHAFSETREVLADHGAAVVLYDVFSERVVDAVSYAGGASISAEVDGVPVFAASDDAIDHGAGSSVCRSTRDGSFSACGRTPGF